MSQTNYATIRGTPEHIQFNESLRTAARQLLGHSKKLKELALRGKTNADVEVDTDEEFNEATYLTSQSIVELVTIVRNFILSSKDNQLTVEQNYLFECLKQVKDSSVNFINAAKSCAANPFDYLSTQRLTNTTQETVDHLKELLNAAENGTAPAAAEIPKIEVPTTDIIDDVKKTNTALNIVATFVETNDIENFKLAAKAFLMCMTRLMDLASDLGLTPVQDKLKEAALSTIQTAKVALSQPDDPLLTSQWQKARKNATQAIQTFVFSSSKTNTMRKSFVDNIMLANRSSESLLDNEENNAKLEIGVQIVNALKTAPSLAVLEKEDKQLCTLVKDMQTSFRAILDNKVVEKDVPITIVKIVNERSMKEWQLILQEFAGSKKMMEASEKRDYRKVGTLKMKSDTPMNISTELSACSKELSEHVLHFINHISKSIVKIDEISQDKAIESIADSVLGTVKLVMDLIFACLEGRSSLKDTKKPTDPEKLYVVVEKILTRAREKMNEVSNRGVLEQNMVSAANEALANTIENYHHLRLQLEGMLFRRLFSDLNATRAVTTEIVRTLSFLGKSETKNEYSILLELTAMSGSLSKRIQSILNTYETCIYLSRSNRHLMHSSSQRNMLKEGMPTPIDDVNIWEDKTKLIYSTTSSAMLGGTLNQLIVHLTTVQDTSFVSTFVTTYQSFTSPWIFLNKLSQRFSGPPVPTPKSLTRKPSKSPEIDPQMVLRVKLRVCVVLKYWIENQFADFDASLIDKLSSFINETIRNDQLKEMVEMANRLSATLQDQIQKHAEQRIVFEPIKEFNLEPRNSMSAFMELNESEIARQLTLIEFNTFKAIEPSELLNQAWNKPKLQHKSPNVMALISRSNRIAFWVATMIVINRKLSDRVKVIDKFARIAQFLRLLNNFNTLTAIVAGLNVSSVSRLKHTFSKISPISQSVIHKSRSSSDHQLLTQWQELMDPSNSYRNYRATRKEATSKGPVMPYIGVPLSDLTFSEDGNPDNLPEDKKLKGVEYINFAKREIICKIIMDIQLNQQDKYPFPVVESIMNILNDLPYLEDKELYDLSLICEPRGCDISVVEM